MEAIRRIQKLEIIKILADERRYDLLQRLMAGPESLSSLGKALGEHPARVRHHLKLLEKAGLVEQVSTRTVRGFTEKYYRARARAFVFQELVLPAIPKGEHAPLVLLGSHDLALERLAEQLGQANPNSSLMVVPVGSLEGLLALRQGSAQLAGCHLLDAQSGEYNLPFVTHILPDREINLVTLAHRTQGIIVAKGNPRQIHTLEDLGQPEVTFINRNPGSGTRLWLDRQLRELGLAPEHINGYNLEARTHTAVAEAVLQGRADAGLGLQAAAQLSHLDFVPLFQERYDLVIPRETTLAEQMRPLLDFLNSSAFRQMTSRLAGYDTSHSGELVAKL